MKVKAIAAMDEGRVIGCRGKLPWHLPEDMRRVSQLTTGNLVVMGRATFESLPAKFRPLPNRKNIVVSRGDWSFEGVEVWNSVEACVAHYKALSDSRILWIFGGEQIYTQTLPYWDELILTKVNGSHEGDTFFPVFEQNMELLGREEHEGFCTEVYGRKP